jgi:hypothetical protein
MTGRQCRAEKYSRRMPHLKVGELIFWF